jgi:hypothetical protein
MGQMKNRTKQQRIRRPNDITRFGISHNRPIPNRFILPRAFLVSSPASSHPACVAQASSPASAGGVPPPVPTAENTTRKSLPHNRLRKVPSYSNLCGEGCMPGPVRRSPWRRKIPKNFETNPFSASDLKPPVVPSRAQSNPNYFDSFRIDTATIPFSAPVLRSPWRRRIHKNYQTTPFRFPSASDTPRPIHSSKNPKIHPVALSRAQSRPVAP